MPDRNDQRTTDAQQPRVVVDFALLRRLAAQNFRDLGGHPARGDHRVKLSRVYRSSHIAELPEAHPIRDLTLKTLVTLQSRMEVNHIGPPEATMLKSVRWEHIPIGDRWFTDAGFTRITSEPGKEHLALVMHFREEWGTFFKLLAERDVHPLLFHCSAGRDRTGVGAAMLLELLGVERERIVADFLESNTVFPQMPLTPAQLAPVFESIDEVGGADAFMREVIGLKDADIDAIRSDLLE